MATGKINETYFGRRQYKMHTNNIAEAPEFASEEEAEGLIKFITSSNTGCHLHTHLEHLPNGDDGEDYFVFTPECIQTGSNVGAENTSTLDGISAFFHKLMDAANRYANKPMTLTKIVMHKYGFGASSPPHADVFPLATLLYLNGDYEGGELYFPNQDFEIKPQSRSLLVFDGGGENIHGVKQIKGNMDIHRPRYVLVAFWDYLNNSDQHVFSEKENELEKSRPAEVEFGTILSRYGNNARVLFKDTFPILEIKNFIKDDAIELIRFLEINDDGVGDECWAPVCFREYWERLNPDSDRQPIFTDDVHENTIKDINLKIQDHVEFFLQQKVAFSKFKGHYGVTGSSAPPHNHPPAIAVAIVALDQEFSGGEVFIPGYDIEFNLEAGNLYIFPESESSRHGVGLVKEGVRKTLVSHWQSLEESYDWAGVDN